MLQDMRDGMNGPIVWGIIGFLCLLFAIWGIGADSFFGGGGGPALAKVGSVKITQSAFQNAYNRSYQRLIQMMGENFDPAKINQTRFRAGVLDNLIDQSVLDQYATQAGFVATDHDVYDYLQTIPAFQLDGHFSTKAYREALANSGMSTEQFENQVRDSLRVEQLRNLVLRTAFVVPKQAKAAWTVSNETRDVDEIVFSPADYSGKIKVADDKVQAYYQAHKSQYVAPLKVKLAYIELSQAALKPATPPGPDVLKPIYEAQKASRFTTPEQREASHILIKFGADAGAAEKKIEAIAAKIASGANFETLAKKDSDDAGSKAKGGSLGWLQRGMTAPAFEKALFGLAKAGDVSKPVKTKFGWELIRLDAVRPSKALGFDAPEVQKQLLATFNSRYAAKRFQDASGKLANLVFENPASLKPAAETLGLKVQTTDWITRKGGSGIAAKSQVIDAAFSDTVLKNAENSKPITIGSADQVVIRKAAEQPEHQLSFDEVKDRIHEQLVQDAASTQAKAAADALASAVKGGASVADAAKAAGVKVTPLNAVKRDAPLGPELVKAVFALPRPGKDGKPEVTVARLSKGRYGVIVLHAVNVPATGVGDPQFAKTARQYNQSLAGSQFDAYRKLMRKDIGVERESAPKTLEPTGSGQ